MGSIIINFPLTYEDVVVSEYSMSVDFTISITPYGLTNAPATKVTHHVQNDSVIGWGSLVVPHVKDGEGASVPYDVLLIKRVTTSLDSLYLYGQPAPEALLTAFGIVQGSVSSSNRLMFWRENSRILLLSMGLNNSFSNVLSANYDLDTELSSTSINTSDDNNSDLVVFPNPVKNNLNIRLSDGINGAFKISIIDIYGNSVVNSHFESNTHSLELPKNITNGTYFVRVSDETGRIISKSKIIVNK